MLSVTEAKTLLFKNLPGLSHETMKAEHALGRVLHKPVKSLYRMPNFRQSAVDGFVVKLPKDSLLNAPVTFRIMGEIQAGDGTTYRMKPGEAYRIYTGAPVPHGAYAVVMQERVSLLNHQVMIPPPYLIPNANIREAGCMMGKGEVILPQGHLLNPGSIGLLASAGHQQVVVSRLPSIDILSTGNELIKPGLQPGPAQVFESNGVMLASALQQAGVRCHKPQHANDRQGQLKAKLQAMLKRADVVIITGGISVGAYDLVKGTLQDLGVRELLYKVAQKPGKPLFIGLRGQQMIFALPGNPAAALVCFYEYVLPAIRGMMGHTDPGPASLLLPLLHSYEVKGDRELFLKARYTMEGVSILEGQASNLLGSFADANAIVYLPVSPTHLDAGTPVTVHLLPC